VGYALLLPTALADPRVPWSAETVDFVLKANDEFISYRIMSISVLPGGTIELETLQEGVPCPGTIIAPAGELVQYLPSRWKFTAPRQKGTYFLKAGASCSVHEITLNVFVMVPSDEVQNKFLNGCRIGVYPKMPKDGPGIYERPAGFIEVTEDNAGIFVSPHFTLSQFVCKQEGGYPKYLVLQGRLLIKLEKILSHLNEAGYRCRTFTILSGYRTPWYNETIGNAKYSYHLWGGAADICIDEAPEDGMMDDINNDGRVDCRDTAVIAGIIHAFCDTSWDRVLTGGLAQYRKTEGHGPFVHVDVRGFLVRWGHIPHPREAANRFETR